MDYDTAVATIKALTPGQSVAISGVANTLIAKRTDDNRSWFLRLASAKTHARWCDTEDYLREDVYAFLVSDYLPVGKMW